MKDDPKWFKVFLQQICVCNQMTRAVVMMMIMRIVLFQLLCHKCDDYKIYSVSHSTSYVQEWQNVIKYGKWRLEHIWFWLNNYLISFPFFLFPINNCCISRAWRREHSHTSLKINHGRETALLIHEKNEIMCKSVSLYLDVQKDPEVHE